MNLILLTVAQANLYIKNIFSRDKVLNNIAIKGEISNLKFHPSGHIYMSLKDENSVLRAIMFRGATNNLDFKLENGLKVVAGGQISLYEKDGQYHLCIKNIKPDGFGELHVAFEKMKKKLDQEGLFDPKHKKPLPKFPKRIGIITAKTGAAIRDIVNILGRRFRYSKVLLYPVLVQGQNAASEMVEALLYFNREKNVDVIIIGRGGGSIEDLWAFNNELLARTIFKSKIPIISAVGHEIDFTISDFVADLRAPTPSAAAELVVPSEIEMRNKISNLNNKMVYLMNKLIEKNKTKIKYIKSRINGKIIISQLNDKKIYIDSLLRLIESYIDKQVLKKRQLLETFTIELDTLNPYEVLNRGYAIVRVASGNIIKKITQLTGGQKLDVVLKDGYASCLVEKIEVKN